MNIYRQSFDYNNNPSQLFDSGTGIGGGGGTIAVIANASARTGANGMRIANPTGGAQWVQKNLSSFAEIFLGNGLRINSTATAANVGLFQFVDGATAQVTIAVNPSGQLVVTRGGIGGTSLGTSASTVSFSNFHQFELHLKINSTTGIVLIKIDGTTVINLTAQNTQSSGNASFNGFLIGNTAAVGGTVSIDFDDIVMNDPTGSFNNTFTGIAQILCNLPNSNGTLNNWSTAFATFLNSHLYVVGETFSDGTNVQRCTVQGTSASSGTPTWATTGGLTTTSGGATFAVVGTGANPGIQNWMAVSEIPPDDASSQNTDATVNDTDRYKFASIAAATVLGVCVTARVNINTAGARSFRLIAENVATTLDNGADLPLTTSEQYFGFCFDTDPNTSAAWVAAGVNTAELGVKLTV